MNEVIIHNAVAGNKNPIRQLREFEKCFLDVRQQILNPTISFHIRELHKDLGTTSRMGSPIPLNDTDRKMLAGALENPDSPGLSTTVREVVADILLQLAKLKASAKKIINENAGAVEVIKRKENVALLSAISLLGAAMAFGFADFAGSPIIATGLVIIGLVSIFPWRKSSTYGHALAAWTLACYIKDKTPSETAKLAHEIERSAFSEQHYMQSSLARYENALERHREAYAMSIEELRAYFLSHPEGYRCPACGREGNIREDAS